MWQRSFVGVQVLAGGTLEEARAALPEGAETAAATEALVRELSDPKRTVRARALAAVGEEVLRAVKEITLR